MELLNCLCGKPAAWKCDVCSALLCDECKPHHVNIVGDGVDHTRRFATKEEVSPPGK